MNEPAPITDEEIDRVYRQIDSDAESAGYHLSPDVAFVKLSPIARISGPPTSTSTNRTAGEMRTDARTPGRSKTSFQRLPRGRAAASASNPTRSY